MKFRYSRLIFVIAIIAIIIYLICIICKNNSKKQASIVTQNNESVQYAKDLKLGITNFDTINPLKTNNKEVININKLIFEPLFTLDEQYKLTTCLATEFAKISETTYIIKIDTNIQWSNGQNISAADVVYTVQNLKKVKSVYSENVQNISAIEQIDENTVKIELFKEEMFFEYNLIFPIVCKNHYNYEDYFLSSKIPIGTGMLKILNINDNIIELGRNENWRNYEDQKLNCEKVYIYLFKTMGEVYNSFKIGNIDFINTSNMSYADYIGTIGYYSKEYKGREVDFISMNCNDNILCDKLVRKAINYAIDKNSIISSIYNNTYYSSEYPIDFGTFVYKNELENLAYNPEQAKITLQSAGWKNINNKWIKQGKTLSLNIIVNSANAKRCEVADIIKQQLEQIGISINIKKVSDSQYLSYLQNKNFQIILTGVSNGFSPDIAYFYGNKNISNYNNQDVQNILKELKNITDEKLLLEKYKKIVEITKDEIPYICLYRNKNVILVKQNAGGKITPNNYNIYYNFESWHRDLS